MQATDTAVIPGEATQFNHNTYIADSNNITLKNNIFMRPSSMNNKFTANIYGVKALTNTGNGYILEAVNVVDTDSMQLGTYTLTCTQQVENGGVFSVRAPDGSYLSDATTGVTYSDVLSFKIIDGSIDWALGDSITIEIKYWISSDIEMTNNLYIDGEIGIGLGGNSVSPYRFKDVDIIGNVFTKMNDSKSFNRDIAWVIEARDWDVGNVLNNCIIHNDEPNSYAIATRGTSRNLRFSGNVIYDFKNVLNAIWIKNDDGSGISATTFSDNLIDNPTSSGVTIRAEYDTAGKWTFQGNKYFSDRAEPYRFYIGGDVTFDSWKTLTGDNSTFEQHSFPDPTRSIETYMASLGETATIDVFIAKARAQDRYNWDTRYTADAVNDYIRAGFGMGQRRLFRNVRIGEVEP